MTEQDSKQEEGFATPEVLKETGITMRQLDYWCTKGYIWPSLNDSKGSGDPRKFSKEDVARIGLIKLFLSEGYTLKASANLANQQMTEESHG